MPNYSDNHDYQLFEDNEEEWEHRTDFENLDIDVEIRDTEESLNDYTPKNGALFRATDTGTIYLGNGDDWSISDFSAGSIEADSISIGGSEPITNPAGNNLSIVDGALHAEGGSGSAAGSEVIVTSGSDLQDALDSNGVVRIAGVVDVSDESPIQVPSYRSIFGYGTFEYSNHPQAMDVIYDDSSGPTLEFSGNHIRAHGIGIANNHPDGIGIKCTGYSPNISTVDIDAGYIGVQFGDESSSTTHTEPRIEFCKIYSHNDAPGDGSMGIYVEDMHDAKIIDNSIGGYDIGISADTNHAYLTGNHVYAYPASQMSTGIRIAARWVRAVNNRVEDSIQNVGIELADWFGDIMMIGNLIEVSTGADGVQWSTDISDGEISNFVLSHNQIGTTWGADNGDTAVNIGAELHRSYVGNNIIYDFDNEGDTTITSSGTPSASNHLPGVTVEDTSNGTLWYRTSNDMVQIG